MKVRALTFCKRFANVQHNGNWWATLGHTDEMECTELKDMTLSDINRLNNETFAKDSSTMYHHVVYLIDSEPKDNIQTADNELWENSGFLSITRIHFPNTTGLQGQFEKVNKHFADLASKGEYQEVTWRTYYTMELSDMVLVSKSKTFKVLSRWSLLATKCRIIGKAYTYFCIPGSILDANIELPDTLKNDCIDFLAVRFVIRDNQVEDALSDAWKTLGKDESNPPFRVAGNEDAIICGQSVPMLNLITLYRKWYQDDSIFKAFRDISTRIGADWAEEGYEPDKSTPDGGNKKDLEKFSCKVLEKVHGQILSKGAHGNVLINREWMRPLVELTNALVHMSSSATLDEPVFQILPGLNAFWDNVFDESQPLLDEPLYLRFAELCVHTMEHLMRAEGQLSQRLEVRPLAYDIPVFVLEYVTAFLLTLSAEMTKPDGKSAERISFLLVPSAEKDVSTVEPFRANGKTPGLLLITVPFSLLYKPKQLITALCHEIAHYVGEELRMREKRYDFFLECATTELLTYFFEDISGEVNKLREYVKSFFLDKILRAGTEALACQYGNFIKIPLLVINDKICNLAYAMVDTDAYADFVRRYVLSDLRGASFNSISKQSREEKLTKFVNRMLDLSISFREAYADICMVYFLELEPREYLDSVLHQGEEINPGTILRAYVVLLAMGTPPEEILMNFSHWGRSHQIESDNRMRITDIISDITKEISRSDATSEKFLADYIRQCWIGLNASGLRDSDTTDGYQFTSHDIYEKILNLDSTTSYAEILEVIDSGRQIALEQLKKCIGEEDDSEMKLV